jgi:hypothetical protein
MPIQVTGLKALDSSYTSFAVSLGCGVETKIANSLIAGFEARWRYLGNHTFSSYVAGDPHTTPYGPASEITAAFRLGYKFGGISGWQRRAAARNSDWPKAASAQSAGKDTEWPETAASPDESQISELMPEVFVSTDAFRESDRSSLSRSMPQDMSGFEPSVERQRAPKGWQEDGEITKAHASKSVPGPGDLVYGRMRRVAPVKVGDLLYVLRRDVATDADEDPDALYLERIGVAQVEAVLPRRRVLLRVLKSVSEVAPDDLLSRTPL